jgi:hypothetical protein
MDLQDSELICIVSHHTQKIRPARAVIFPEEFDGTEISNIPEGVEEIEITKVGFHQYSSIHLPKSLKTLHLDCKFREIELPDALEYIKLGPCCKGEIKQWPKSLKELFIWCSDIDSLPPLPDSLEYLRLDFTFDNKFSKCQWIGFPKSLKSLIVDSLWFGQGTERSLWLKDLSNLKYLEFRGGFSSVSVVNAIIENLPFGLKIVKNLIILKSPKDIQGQLPDSLEYFEGDFNYKGTLPRNLKVFHSPSCEISSALPESLEYLYVSSVKGEALKSISRLSKLETLVCDKYNPSYEKDVSFPSSLEYLHIKSSAYNITSFPDGLKTLIIPGSALPVSIRLPEKLETLRLTKCGFTSDLHLPTGLKKITFLPRIMDAFDNVKVL